MEICKFFFFNIFVYCLLISSIFAEEKNIFDNIKLTPKDIILLKFQTFMNKRVTNASDSTPILTMIVYQNIFYEVEINKNNDINIYLTGIMDKKRYKKKKYYPKISDCNVLRNRIFLNVTGYSFFLKKKNYKISEEDFIDVMSKNILNFETIDEKTLKNIMDKTYIYIKIIHPKSKHNFSCNGKMIEQYLE